MIQINIAAVGTRKQTSRSFHQTDRMFSNGAFVLHFAAVSVSSGEHVAAMAFEVPNREALETTVAAILSALGTREVTERQVVYLLSNIIRAAAADDEKELRAWLNPHEIARWKEECRVTQS